MHEPWRDSFQLFLEYVGPRPSSKHSLDRIDAKGNYVPGNVRWATLIVQARNKRGTKWVNHPDTGKPIKAAELAEEKKVEYQTLRQKMIEDGTWYLPVRLEEAEAGAE